MQCFAVQCGAMHRFCVDRYKTILRKAAPLVLKSKVDIVFWEEGYRCSRSGTDDWIVVTSKRARELEREDSGLK